MEDKEFEERSSEICSSELFDIMRRKGIKVSTKSTADIHVACSYLLIFNKLTLEKLIDLNHKIVAYIERRKDTMTSDDFVPLMKRSKALRHKFIDWEYIDKQSESLNKKFDKVMKEFEKNEPGKI